MILLTVRRFICGAAGCSRRTFAEPFSRLTAPYARFTTRLNRALDRVGSLWRDGPVPGWPPNWGSDRTDDLATQGYGTARSAVQHAPCAGRGRLRNPPRPDLLHCLDLRRIPSRGRCASDPRSGAAGCVADQSPRRGDHLPRPCGCLCRGRPTRRPRCSPDRGPVPPVAGPRPSRRDLRRRPPRLPAHPAAHRHVDRSNAPGGPDLPQNGSDPVGRRAERKKAAHALVHELLAQGHSRRAIARHLGWGLNTVLRYAAAARWQDTFRENRPRPSRLDPYKPYLERRFAAGCTSVSGCTANCSPSTPPSPTRWSAPTSPPCARPVGHAAPAADGAAGDRLAHPYPTALSEEDRADLKNVLAHCPALDAAAGHVRDFGEILPTASAPLSRPGSTPSTPANCPASPTSHSTYSETSTP